LSRHFDAVIHAQRESVSAHKCTIPPGYFSRDWYGSTPALTQKCHSMAGLKFPCTVLPTLPGTLLPLRELSASLSDTLIFWSRSATPTIGFCMVALIYLLVAIVNTMAYFMHCHRDCIDCVFEFGDLFCPATDSHFVVGWSH
jgi:hypothetical protein